MDKLDTIKRVFRDGKKKQNFTLKLFVEGNEVWNIRSHSKRRILHSLRTIKNETRPFIANLRVSYGMELDHSGKLSPFYNDGCYSNYEDLNWAFNAFSED